MRVGVVAVMCASLGGCSLFVDDSGSRPGDPDARPQCADWTPASPYIDPCAIPAPGPALTSSDEALVFDTEAGTLTDAGGTEIEHVGAPVDGSDNSPYVISTGRFELASGSLRIVGQRPLVIASWSDAIVTGSIDVGSDGQRAGAGSSIGHGACVASTQGAPDIGGAGGGGSGGFQGSGGSGGIGGAGNAMGGDGGQPIEAPTTLRGGCPGAPGGDDLGGSGGLAGAPGGALAIVAFDGIDIKGVVRAGGQGGLPATDGDGGGGGAGSGGLLAFDGASLVVTGELIANGGGGGAGASDDEFGTAGGDGDEATRAPGGSALGGGRDGGGGSGSGFLDGLDGLDATSNGSDGGGGGGGGAGYVLIWGAALTGGGISSPAETPMP